MIKDIPGFEGYYTIDEDANVYSIRAKKYLKPYIDPHGRYKVCFSVNNKRKDWPLHRLMLFIFKGFDNKRVECNHIDGNPSNNKLSNLEWVTASENMQHAHNLKLHHNGQDHHWSKLTDREACVIRKLYADGHYTQKQLADFYEITQGAISSIINNKVWNHVKIKY